MSSLLALSTLPWHSMAVSVKCCSLHAQRHQPSFSVTLMTAFWTSAVGHRRQQAIMHRGPLPSTCEFMQSARIAFSCFTRPRFELGLSSRAPQISVKRVRLTRQAATSSVNPSRCGPCLPVYDRPVVINLCMGGHRALMSSTTHP